MITVLRDEYDYGLVYGIIISDDGINIYDMISEIKHSEEFIAEFGHDGWSIDDVLEKLSHKICFEFETDFANAFI